MRGMTNKVAVVTGGGAGIGLAICRRLAEEGCVVGVFDIDFAAAEAAAVGIAGAGGKAHAVACDVSDYDGVNQAVADFETEAGAVDILINNAGWDRFMMFTKTEPALWDRIIAINLKGPLNMLHVALPGMIERGSGKVVNIASDAARVGSLGEAVYSATKGGLVALSKSLARETATKGICLNCVCPGPTETSLLSSVAEASGMGDKLLDAFAKATPMRRLGKVDDLPGAVAFLASDDADFITGQVISVSGGLTMNG
jgi:2-hydroxycyclohexanecarboxyl-CoA dehydrogenase